MSQLSLRSLGPSSPSRARRRRSGPSRRRHRHHRPERRSRAVSPLIYGVNFGSLAQANRLRWPVRRWGGNSVTRYSWEFDTHNTASDWFFFNIVDGNSTNLPERLDRRRLHVRDPGRGRRGPAHGSHHRLDPQGPAEALGLLDREVRSAAEQRVHRERQRVLVHRGRRQRHQDERHAHHHATIPPTPRPPSTRPTSRAGCSTSRRSSGRRARAGSGSSPSTTSRRSGPRPTRTSIPRSSTYDELWQRTRDYAAAIKAQDPAAQVFGPADWGWCAYFFSAADDCGPGADRAAHGSLDFLDWYLKQAKDYADAHARPASHRLPRHPLLPAGERRAPFRRRVGRDLGPAPARASRACTTPPTWTSRGSGAPAGRAGS